MQRELVSVIIPVFNREDYIADTLESVLAQSYETFELIVIDDGSSDRSAEAISSFEDPRIRFFQQKNRGLAATWNVGLKAARGSLVKLLDSDDLIDPDFLKCSVEAFAKDETADVVYSNYRLIDSHGSVLENCRVGPVDNLFYRLLFGNMFSVHEVLFSRGAIQNANLFDENIRICEDWDLHLRLARTSHRYVHLDSCLSSHRVHPGTYKKLVVDRFEQVIEKTFGDPSLPEEYRALRPVSEARHALYLLSDILEWGWEKEIEPALRNFVESTCSALKHPNGRELLLEWVIPWWPLALRDELYSGTYRAKLVELGMEPTLLELLDGYLASKGQAGALFNTPEK